jgi:ceramide kinase
LRLLNHRPRTLLVLLNPYGGARKARSVWRDIALPVFELAGIKCVTVETERLGHARQVIEDLTQSEVDSYDGIVAVGGDGLFQEVMNGLLLLRARGGHIAEVAARMRLGHVPAGSTDAVAYSLNGTRSELTAALHIALGDRMPLDVMRVDTEDGHYRYSVCVASYGYMGDLMKQSERMRWVGPARYNLAGAATLFKGRNYKAKVSWLPAQTRRDSVCNSKCDVCGLQTPHTHGQPEDTLAFTLPSQRALATGNWRTREGTFKSVMAIVTTCRSDQSTYGLSPYSHLADGRIHLVMVQKCSILHYLRFLASIPTQGVQKNKFPYVQIAEATAVKIEPVGKESCWNVDGELLDNNHVTARVHRGLLEVFARGVES